MLAVREARRPRPTIIGFDEYEETLNGIQAATIFGTVVQNPYEFGYQSIKILASLARARTTERPQELSRASTPEPHLHSASGHHKDNVEAFQRPKVSSEDVCCGK